MFTIHRYVTLKRFLVPLLVSSVFSTVTPFALLAIPSNAVAKGNHGHHDVSTVRVNGSSGPLTVPAGGILTVGVQNGGTATAWIALYKTTDPNYVPDNYLFMNGAKTPSTTLIQSATFTFTVPTTGTYEVRLFANNIDFTQLAASPTVTVASPPPALLTPPAPTTSTVAPTTSTVAPTTSAVAPTTSTVAPTTSTVAPTTSTVAPTTSSPSSPASSACSTGCFYISPAGNDSNPGTTTAPWRTITKAAQTLTSGQTGVIIDGTYTENTVRPVNNGTATAPIRLLAQHKWQAILLSTAGCQPGINIFTSYFIVEDLRIGVAPGSTDCTIFTSSNEAIKAWQTQEPHITGPADSGAVGFVARGNLIDFHQSRTGAMKTNQDYSLIENNTVHSEIETMNASNTIVRGNIVYDGGPNLSYIYTKGGGRNVQVYNNILHIKQGGAVGVVLGGTSGTQWLFDPASGVECYNCVAYNNVVINESGGQTPTPGLVGMSSCQDCVVMNNVGIGGQLFMQGRGNRNPTFKNNIMTCDSTAAATGGWNGWDGFWNGTVNVDYNNFYQCSSAQPGQLFGAAVQSHAVVGDPQFVNPSADWHLQTGSVARGSGNTVTVPAYGGGVTDVSKNRDDVTRTAPWNLGVY